MVNEDFVYSRIGMALISAQRVEFVTGELLTHLIEFDKEVYGITSSDFLDNSKKSKKAIMTLGVIFKLLKLNPKLVIEDELNEYLKRRNLLVHGFWKNYLNTKSETQAKTAIDFCYEFGKLSNQLERFFKGFIFFLALRHVAERSEIDTKIKEWESDFEYFLRALNEKYLLDK